MNTFTILAEPSRRVILDTLLNGAMSVNTLVDAVGMSQPVVSKHLRILREAGLVSVNPRGQQRLYSIRAEPLIELEQWLAPYRQFWHSKLDALESHLNEL